MLERKASYEYGTILIFCKTFEIETCWKENVADVSIKINVLVVVEELMKKQATCWQQTLAVGSTVEETYE